MSNIQNDHNNDDSNLGSLEEDQQLNSHKENSNVGKDENSLSQSSEDETTEANDANAARNAVEDGNHNSALRYTDRNRNTSTRANEATSRNDSNTGGLGSGGGNSSAEIM